MRNIWNRHKRIKHVNSFIFRVPVLASRVTYILRVLSPIFMVLGPGSYLRDRSLVSGLGSHQKLQVSSRTFRICKTSLVANFETFPGNALAPLCFIPWCLFKPRENTHPLPQISHLNIPFCSISSLSITQSNLWEKSMKIHLPKMLPPAVHTNLLNSFQPSNHCLMSPFSENVYAGSTGRYLNFKPMD